MATVQKGGGKPEDYAAVQTQIERLKTTGGEDLSKLMDLDQVQQDAKGGGIRKGLMNKIKTDFFGINMGTEVFKDPKKALSEAFSMNRLFGDAGTGKLSNVRSLQGSAQFEVAELNDPTATFPSACKTPRTHRSQL